ncbi:hypothetical protein KM043_006831 [Ampulex compressa]|nr:hypothetical protein KM043_006831 [Ampulex compressa]
MNSFAKEYDGFSYLPDSNESSRYGCPSFRSAISFGHVSAALPGSKQKSRSLARNVSKVEFLPERGKVLSRESIIDGSDTCLDDVLFTADEFCLFVVLRRGEISRNFEARIEARVFRAFGVFFGEDREDDGDY